MLLILLKNHSVSEIKTVFLNLKMKWLLAAVGCVFLSYLSEMMCFYEITKRFMEKHQFAHLFASQWRGVFQFGYAICL